MNINMTPIDWAKRPVMEKYADFTGRAPRAEYWWYALALIIVGLVLSIVESITGLKGMVFGIYGPLTALLWLATIVPGVAVGVRRLHDSNRSGWWMLLVVPYLVVAIVAMRAMAAGNLAAMATSGLLALIGMVLCIVLLIFMVLPSSPGENRYGPNPYGEGVGAVPAE
ncbi:MAG TPA: DUF805 domain-containing protein [Sphingomicrobium sp.]|jgi:uncharacterized membrane protein YhaH (DUF805 family)|nr:DUF805 domain-containing protein [Sphingomicrobium sp.]